MKTTIELPDELLVEAKKHAAERRTTMRALIESGLRRELTRGSSVLHPLRKIRWVTVRGPLPAGLDVADRAKMMDYLMRNGHDRD